MRYIKEVATTINYDVVVIGGGPAGICATVSAARQGAKTLLVERYGVLGGMMTSGHVDPILGSVSEGTMYDEVVKLLAENHDGIKPQVTRNGTEVQVDPEEAKIIFPNLVRESGADFFLQSTVVDTIKEGDLVTGVIITTPTGLMAVYGKCIIDCSGDGYVAACAGSEYEVGRETDGRCQPTTHEFVISNVDEANAITCFGGSDPIKLRSGKKYSELCKEANERGELPQNVSIVRLHKTFYPGERSVNATQANNHNTLSLHGIADAEIDLRNQIMQVINFLRKNILGYENCQLKSSADTLGVRETRRIIGDYIMQDEDIEEGKRFDDVIVHKAWFLIDIHNPNGGGQAEKQSKQAKPYDIPYRAFIPKRLDNLLVAGRCISGTHRAHASYRVMAICMAMGEAVGVAAALCAKQGISPRELSFKSIQEILLERGVVLFD